MGTPKIIVFIIYIFLILLRVEYILCKFTSHFSKGGLNQSVCAPYLFICQNFIIFSKICMKSLYTNQFFPMYCKCYHPFIHCILFLFCILTYKVSTFLCNHMYHHFVIIITIFLSFQGHTLSIWRVPGWGSNWSCSCHPTSRPQQCQIQPLSSTYTIAHSNARSLTQ